MHYARIRNLLSNMRSCSSGNATLMMALGMPMLIGGAGLAVDVSQWYMWKREMQYAVDQAAIAGAWAQLDSTLQLDYATRARQEYQANVAMVDDFDTTPVVALANFNSTVANSVVVTAQATKTLPFTGVFYGEPAVVNVSAQATFAAGVGGSTTSTTVPAVTGCLVALHPTAEGALTIGGTASGTVNCGGVALSNHPQAAIQENGNPDALFSTLAAAGGIETSLNDNVLGGVTNVRRNVAGLSDPFADMPTPVGSSTARTYPATCPTGTASTYKATTTPTVFTSYFYVYANNESQARSRAAAGTNTYAYGTPLSSTEVPGTATNNVNVFSYNTDGTYVDSGAAYAATRQVATSPSKAYEVKRTYTRTTYSNFVETPGISGIVTLEPGTYTSINIACDTHFNPGIYTIEDSIDFSENQVITGSDVLFIMETANSIDNINSNTEINLSGISSSTLQSSYGFSSTNATKLAGMLFWDPESTEQVKWNGNSVSILNGTMYMPNRPLWFNGTSAVSGRCMMLVGKTLTFTGTVDLSSFCQTSGSSILTSAGETTTTVTVAALPAQVRLVS